MDETLAPHATQFAQLVQRFRDATTAGSAAVAAADTDSAQCSNSSGFEIVAAIGVERLNALLAARLDAQAAPGQRAHQDHEFLDALQAAFWALRAPSSTTTTATTARECEQWRKCVFAAVVQHMHALAVPDALAAAILNVLLRELHELNVHDLPGVIDELLRGVTLSQQLQRLRPTDGLVVFHSIELLPQLLLRVAQCPALSLDDDDDIALSHAHAPSSGAAFRDRALLRLFALAWPRRFFLQVLKTFRDVALSPEHEHALCAKVFREVHCELPDTDATPPLPRSSDISAEMSDSTDFSATAPFEALPTVFYNVVLLIGRTKSALCRRLLMNLLLRKCDAVARTSAALYAEQRATRRSVRSAKSSTTTSQRDVQVLLSTLVYHVDLVLKHDEALAAVFLAAYELRSNALSAFDVALLLTVATLDKFATRVFALLIQRVVASYAVRDDDGGGATDTLFRDAPPGVATRAAFLDTVAHPQDGSWSGVTQRMVHFGFELLAYETTPAVGQLPLPWHDFAIRVVLACFQHHDAARLRIVDQAVNAVVVQDRNSRAALQLLARVIQRHALELTPAIETRLQEALALAPQLAPSLARALFAALRPLLQLRPGVQTFAVLTLRKAMFRKDERSRIVAIIGLAFLLGLAAPVFRRTATLTQLYSQNATAMLSQGVVCTTQNTSESDGSSATAETASAAIAEDLFRQFCGVFRRALALQTRVRLVLYAELARVFHDCAPLRAVVLDLALAHVRAFDEPNESLQPPLRLDATLARARGAYDEPLGYLLHVLLRCVRTLQLDAVDAAANSDDDRNDAMLPHDDAGDGDDAIAATQSTTAQRTFETAMRFVTVLMERLKRCELADFDIDKQLAFSTTTAAGQSNRRLARTLLDVWEVCVNWTIATASGNDNSSDAVDTLDADAWSALVHFLDMYRWLCARLAESKSTDDKSNGDTAERKRGRPSSKVKALKAAASTASAGTTEASAADAEDFALFFAEHAAFSSAQLLAPASVVTLLDAGLARLRRTSSNGADSDDPLVLLFALERAARVVALAQAAAAPTGPSVLVGESRAVVNRIGAAAFGVFCVCNDTVVDATATATGASKRSPRDSAAATSAIDDVRLEALRVFGATVGVWMTKSVEEAGDCLALALAVGGAHDADELLDDGDASKLENCVVALHALLDALVTRQNRTKDALALLGVIQCVWRKLPVRIVARHEVWMKRALLRGGVASHKLLEAMVQLFLRPHPQQPLLASLALQLTRGLLHYCNGGDSSGSSGEVLNDAVNGPDASTAAPDWLRLDRFDERGILACATAVLARCEEAANELEPVVKAFDAQQRRQTLALTDADSALLESLADATGGAVALELSATSARLQAQFKGICRQLFELCGILLPFVMMDLNRLAVSIRVIRLIGRLYKLLVAMVQSKLRRRDASLPKYLQRLFDRVASELSPTLLQFIACIHEEGKRAVLARSVSAKARARRSAAPTGASAAQSKLIPDVIFQMEQFDVALIKLSKLSKDRMFDQWIRLRQSRDFRFNHEIIKERIDDDGDEKRPRDAYARDLDDDTRDDVELEAAEVAEVDATEALDSVETESIGDETLDEDDEHDDDEDDEGEAVRASSKRHRRQPLSDADDE